MGVIWGVNQCYSSGICLSSHKESVDTATCGVDEPSWLRVT